MKKNRMRKIGKTVASAAVLLSACSFLNAQELEKAQSCDFEGESSKSPWAFTTNAATLGINNKDVAGNASKKLEFYMENQSGGRVATKKFDKVIMGKSIHVKFDWFPGKVNDTDKSQENGGQVRLYDGIGKTAFTLNNTNKAPLAWSVGSNGGTNTKFTNPETWYSVELNFDIATNELKGKVTQKDTGDTEEFTTSMNGTGFNGTIAQLKIEGVRTSGNNITWKTYLDNVDFSVEPIAANSITTVSQLPYKRIYVGDANADTASIGLASSVNAELANGTSVTAQIENWKNIGDNKWDAKKDGVYAFEGQIKTTNKFTNDLNKTVVQYVYNRLPVPETSNRQTEWLDRGLVASHAEKGIFLSWRLLASEYNENITFDVLNEKGKKVGKNLKVTNYLDVKGKAGSKYTLITKVNGKETERHEITATDKDYLPIKVQKPEDGVNAIGEKYSYSLNDATVGDLTGDGRYEIIVKWYPKNAIDSSQQALTAPTLFDAYTLDGKLLWRIDMGLNLTSGAHYNQISVADFDGDGKSEVFLKTADGTTVYGADANGKFDKNKVLGVVGNAADAGKYVQLYVKDKNGNDVPNGHIIGGPEYITCFDSDGTIIDTTNFEFPLEKVPGDHGKSWGDTWYNRSDRFNSGIGYFDGVHASAVFNRGYYARTAVVAYGVEGGKIVKRWAFDTDNGYKNAEHMGNHSLIVADFDNDGFDEVSLGSVSIDHDGSLMYVMDGEQQRELGSHGDASHVGQFFPDVEGLYLFGPHEVPAVASLEMHDAATGETQFAYFASKDAGRGMAANITSNPGYEFWAAAGGNAATGGAVYNGRGEVVVDSWRNAKLSCNFKLYWDGDLLHELLNDTEITKFNELSGSSESMKKFSGTHSCNGTKATPTLQADILGDWREEVVMASADDTELRIYTTTLPTKYRLYTLMHDPVYRNSVGWQQSAYNQPTCLGFYLGEDIKVKVLKGQIPVPVMHYTNGK
ncbi:MAG: rhamnogalacturonan lyase [Treponema sp.]|nr:rhamnogalacturonan lyase [Treponema sp.]